MVKRRIAQTRVIKMEGQRVVLTLLSTNEFGQRIYLSRHPKDWKYGYGVVAWPGREWGWMMVSQHRLMKEARAAAHKLVNRDVLVKLGWRK